MPTMNRSFTLAMLLPLAAGCVGESAPAGAAASGAAADSAAVPFRGEIYEREIVFVSSGGDSAFVTPWFFRAQTTPTGVEREARALLARGGAWDPFHQERWTTPATRSPWRILPRRPLRLVVAEDDVLESLVFQEGSREMELMFGATLTEWVGARGELFRLQNGAVLLANQRLDGVLIDIGRARRSSDPSPGDWAFLVSDSGFQLFLEDPGGVRSSEGGRYRAWTRLGLREVQWPMLSVEWVETRAFDRARRDVPMGWHFSSRDQELRGDLTVRAAHLAVGEGSGPVLPVDALYEVSGTVHMAGTSHRVRGLFRHVQE
jgi:hypothetical protein